MRESDIVSYYEAFRPSFDVLTRPDVDIKKVISFAHKIFRQGKFEDPNGIINSQEFVAATTLVALISNEEGKLRLCGEAYEVLVYLCMKSENIPQVNKFLYTSMEALPAEVFDGVLRGLAAYDLETKTERGKELLKTALRGRTVKEVEEEAKWRTFQYWAILAITRIERPLWGAAIGLLLGQIISSILFK